MFVSRRLAKGSPGSSTGGPARSRAVGTSPSETNLCPPDSWVANTENAEFPLAADKDIHLFGINLNKAFRVRPEIASVITTFLDSKPSVPQRLSTHQSEVGVEPLDHPLLHLIGINMPCLRVDHAFEHVCPPVERIHPAQDMFQASH